MKRTIITNDFSETQNLGKEIAQNIKTGRVICLYGDLGSGKTTFTQGLAEELGVKRKIISPTFIIMRTYDVSDTKKFYHVDLYRIGSEIDVEGLGLFEIMQDPEAIVVIEWPDKIKNFLPKNRMEIFFKYLEDDKREVTVIDDTMLQA